jgi:hypothetical protein
LFDSGKIADLVEKKAPELKKEGAAEGENRLKMLAKIKEAMDRSSVTTALDAYLQKFGELPDDLEAWARMLEHRDGERQREALMRIDQLLDQQRPRRTRAMLGQLRMIRDIGDDPEMVALAEKLIKRLE